MNKPAGLLSQKAEKKDFSANEQLLRYLLDRGEVTKEELKTFRPSVSNRLDRNTSGILLAGKTLAGLQYLSEVLKERAVQKYYLALVEGRMEKPFRGEAWLSKDTVRNQVSISKEPIPGAERIETGYEPLELYRDATLLRIRLYTGKSHQIRAHLSFLSHPILGDPKYGPEQRQGEPRLRRQMLHAREVIFPDGLSIKAPLPKDFENVRNRLKETQGGS